MIKNVILITPFCKKTSPLPEVISEWLKKLVYNGKTFFIDCKENSVYLVNVSSEIQFQVDTEAIKVSSVFDTVDRRVPGAASAKFIIDGLAHVDTHGTALCMWDVGEDLSTLLRVAQSWGVPVYSVDRLEHFIE